MHKRSIIFQKQKKKKTLNNDHMNNATSLYKQKKKQNKKVWCPSLAKPLIMKQSLNYFSLNIFYKRILCNFFLVYSTTVDVLYYFMVY